MVYVILSVGWCISERVAHVATSGFLSRSVNGLLPYVRRHITVDQNVLSVSLNKTFLTSIATKFMSVSVSISVN